jgi:hypothetical protein
VPPPPPPKEISLGDDSVPSSSIDVTDVPPPPPPKEISLGDDSVPSSSIDVTETAAKSLDVTEAVTKSLALSFLSKFQDNLKELVSGDFGWKEILFTVLAIASIAVSCSAMIVEASLLVDVLAWICLIVGPSAAILQRKVSLLESLREITNQLREQVNQVTANNNVLQTQNRRLAKNTKK